MTSSKGTRVDRFQNIAYVLDDIKQLTIIHERPVVGTTQFGRKAGKGGKKGDTENIGFTDTIGTHASIICSAKHMGSNNKRTIDILKGREGEEGEYDINYSFSPMDFSYIEPGSVAEVTETQQAENDESSSTEPAPRSRPRIGNAEWTG